MPHCVRCSTEIPECQGYHASPDGNAMCVAPRCAGCAANEPTAQLAARVQRFFRVDWDPPPFTGAVIPAFVLDPEGEDMPAPVDPDSTRDPPPVQPTPPSARPVWRFNRVPANYVPTPVPDPEGEDMPAPVDRAAPLCTCDLASRVAPRVNARGEIVRVRGVPLFRCGRCDYEERRITGSAGECPQCHRQSVVERMDTRAAWCVDCDRALSLCGYCGRMTTGEGECACGARGGRAAVGFEGEPSPLFPRYLGVEIECGGNAARPGREWFRRLEREGEIDDDGSVSMQVWTMEFRPRPSRGDAFAQRITRIAAMFREVGVEVNRSCGLHVHVDARDFTSSDILKLVRLNQKVESAIYGVVSRSRRSNHFSRPWRDSLMRPSAVRAPLRSIRETTQPVSVIDPAGEEPAEIRAAAVESNLYGSSRAAAQFKARPHKCGERYHGLNLTALPLLGTVEFRHHQGTVNPHKIMMWAALCTAIIEYAKNHTEEEIVRMRGTPAEVLDKLLRGDILRPVRTWVRRRRAFFQAKEHGRSVPHGRAAPVEPPEPLDISTDLEDWESGETGAGGRVGRPLHRASRPASFSDEGA